MNEHEHHHDTPDASPPPAHAPSPSGDREDRQLAASLDALRSVADMLAGRKPDPASSVNTVSLDDAPSYGETNVSVVREGIRRYGQPFLAYLILDGVEQRSPDLIEQYERRYLGSFHGRDSFADWAVRDLGWEADLAELRALHGMWPADVAWDTDRLWPLLIERYALTERLGGVHAFRR